MSAFGKLLAVMLAVMLAALVPPVVAEEAPAGTAQEETAPGESAKPSEGDETPPPGFVLVSTATQAGWLPLPLEGEYSYPLKQVLPDGTEAENVIHLTPEGVYMEDSTCENHDCMEQGMVTLENRKDRILSNMIICLPNQVVLELYSTEEVLAMMQEQQEQQEQQEGEGD